MLRRTFIVFVCAWFLSLVPPARAENLALSISIAAGPLPTGIKDLERQSDIELLYDADLIKDLQSSPVQGAHTTEEALRELLAATDLVVRRATSGAWIIERPATPPLSQQDAAVAEILVVGRRTQNADIRRHENDVQPYAIATRQEIVRSHRDNIDQFFSSRITSSTTTVPSLASQNADANSSIDLRGLGALDTVVLVDGRRMPSIPVPDKGFRQSDLNGIPLHAIERIEVLTGAAGGIHGFGALGGVVNIVLSRDIDGVELYTTQGISSRGDARRRSVEAKLGKSFNAGATDLMLFASLQELDTVNVADRGFAVRDRRRTSQTVPEQYSTLFMHGAGITVNSLFGIDPVTSEIVYYPNLTFKPEYGGGGLGSNFTHLPIGFSGDAAALAAVLREHAGEDDFGLVDSEATGDLGPNPRSDSLLANFRHRFDSGWEAYGDAVIARTRGESLNSNGSARSGLYDGYALIAPESPANPFTDYITVGFPITGLGSGMRKRLENSRYTAGVEAALPFDWRGTAEASWGRLRYVSSTTDEFSASGAGLILLGDESDLERNPLGNWEAFDRAMTSDLFRSRYDLDFHTTFRVQSLRLAGPVFDTLAGPATLTLLAERRSERVPSGKDDRTLEINSESQTNELRSNSRSSVTQSVYGELRTRLFDDSTRLPLVRGLELQLAIRRDEEKDDFPRNTWSPDSPTDHAEFAGTAFTLGAKISPSRWLMLRGSYATGEQPPPLESLIEQEPSRIGITLTPDPKRGDTFLNGDGVLLLSGNRGLDSRRAATMFLGAVLTPTGPDGPRFAIDYSRIHRTRDVISSSIENIIAHEDQWPERVVRAPLTDEDRANGYTAGRIELLDARMQNDASLEMEAFDLRAEWPLTLFGGRLQLYADATYHKRNVQKVRFAPDITWAGYLDGPLKRRANGGFDWSRKQLSIGANLQYYGSSLIFDHNFLNRPYEDQAEIQGSTRIPHQTYLDLYANWQLPVRNFGPVDSLALDLGVVNALDRTPPRESSLITFHGPGYSRYGDSRMRRFELGVNCRF